MKKIVSILILMSIFSCHTKPQQNVLLEDGISTDLALYRKKQISNIVYHLKFNIPLKKEIPILSELKINLEVHDFEHPLYLDFNEDTSLLKKVLVNGDIILINHQKEHLIIDKDYLKKGTNTITIKFNAGELSLNRSGDYLYTLLVPDRASTLFPCFDQPNLKATYTLDITAPKDWKVLCGAPLQLEENQGDYIRHLYKPSDRMSTYLFSFVSGVFEESVCKPGTMEMKLLYRENNKSKINASLNEIFKLHQQSIDFLEDYTQQKFPFQKIDFVSIPGFQYGGMEHVGAIQYREASLFLDSTATQSQKLNRVKLIAHETSHMWFGNLVTMEWFNDVWLKEVFANFIADKIAKPSFPNVNHDLQFMVTHYPSAYNEDRTKGTNPIRQKLDNLKNAGSLYGAIIYDKAPIMMRQLEAVVGEDGFKKGIRNYIKTYANDNATWNDLVVLLDKETDIDLKQWSSVWVNKSGRPIITDNIEYFDGKITSFQISQKAEDGSNNIWPQSFDIGLVYKDSLHITSIQLKDRKTNIKSLIGLPKPKAIIYNYNGIGYGIFPLKNSDSKISQIHNDVARGYAFINLYENMLNNNISPQATFNELLEGLKNEKNELIIRLIVNEISNVFWKCFSNEQRDNILPSFEKSLRNSLHKDLTPGIKKTIFNLYKNIAYSEKGKDYLYAIWNKSKKLINLNLNEVDYTNIATKLAIYNHHKVDEILEKAKSDITNIDRQKEFDFMLPSLSNDESIRDAFMTSLSSPANREKEYWTLLALDNIHHPLRQKSAIKHLRLCLDLLEEIQLTGDIFFPKNWLNSSVGNYSSKEAFKIVETFLKEHPKLNPTLKNKLLQSTDGLYRFNKMNN
ncbi:M1 family aminopeptidase [Wenyingzhuangia sp. chi5]|uniref:Aminopeptidase N n=1 Tax=Wenyingzhuangia gilva TaxID=3057677 RepID=A0ABT8VQS5_9FLAO|nr:M1 family aminopeptidase [Wenyingzhuangia sp. chi5]MDO3694325.1 M1 family aminopeptidase [Wenyingzhuangia sp. chi5]